MTWKHFPHYCDRGNHSPPVYSFYNIMSTFNVLFHIGAGKMLSKQSICRWFETPCCTRDITIQWCWIIVTSYIYIGRGIYTYVSSKIFHSIYMMTSSNGSVFRITGPMWGESTGPRWIPLTKASDAELLMFSLICAWTSGRANNRDAGDMRRHRVHYDVTVMEMFDSQCVCKCVFFIRNYALILIWQF